MLALAITTLGALAKSWFERKKIKAEGKIKLQQTRIEGRIKREQARTDYEAEYDVVAAKGMASSWKDEFWTIVLSIPAILCFVPGLSEYVRAGFRALAECPAWYQTCLIGAIVASFGLKSFMRWKNGK